VLLSTVHLLHCRLIFTLFTILGQSRFRGNSLTALQYFLRSNSRNTTNHPSPSPNSQRRFPLVHSHPKPPNDPVLRQPPHMAISTVDTCCFHSLLIIAAMLRNYWYPGQINRSPTTPTRPRGQSPSSPEPRASVCSALPISHASLGVHLSLSRFLLLPHTTTTLSHIGLEIRLAYRRFFPSSQSHITVSFVIFVSRWRELNKGYEVLRMLNEVGEV
jgi:hypothetical protein